MFCPLANVSQYENVENIPIGGTALICVCIIYYAVQHIKQIEGLHFLSFSYSLIKNRSNYNLYISVHKRLLVLYKVLR